MIEESCVEFSRLLAGKDPVPGGGGAAALTGALGVALGSMAGNLTLGKKRYAAVEGEMLRLLEEAERLRESLLALVEADAGAFEPVMRAYRLPSGSAAERLERARVLEAALEGACEAPLEIMERCAGALRLLEGFAEKGNSSALSDAGAGACLCRAALVAASLNVYANTRVMADRERAAEFDRRAGDLLARWEPAADELIRSVRAALGQAPSGAFAPANPAP